MTYLSVLLFLASLEFGWVLLPIGTFETLPGLVAQLFKILSPKLAMASEGFVWISSSEELLINGDGATLGYSTYHILTARLRLS